jgi:NAD(P)-dependent dehydrogenase (short-subunit alcohol dehydrogenase family)
MRIRDSVAFVTGANRGLGLAFAQELLAGGARKVYAAARHLERITLDGVDRGACCPRKASSSRSRPRGRLRSRRRTSKAQSSVLSASPIAIWCLDPTELRSKRQLVLS